MEVLLERHISKDTFDIGMEEVKGGLVEVRRDRIRKKSKVDVERSIKYKVENEGNVKDLKDKEYHRRYNQEYYKRHKKEILENQKVRRESDLEYARRMGRVRYAKQIVEGGDEYRNMLNRKARENRIKNPEKIRLQDRKSYYRARDKLYDFLGGKKCVCKIENCWHDGECEVIDGRCLQFDHVNDDAPEKGTVSQLIRFYNRNPEVAKRDLQVLCANCNWVKREVRKVDRK